MTDEEIIEELKHHTSDMIMRDVEKSRLVDSGQRTNVGNGGAVRESPEEKGRMDLVPCDFLVELFIRRQEIRIDSTVKKAASEIEQFKSSGNTVHLLDAISDVADIEGINNVDLLIQLSKHFQAGAIKYSEDNWKKGMPVKYYISSAERHLAKYMAVYSDENHFIAFVWNLCAAWWTCVHLPEYNDYIPKGVTK